MRIGMIPTVAVETIKSLGNAASTGASMVLLSKSHWQKTIKLPGQFHISSNRPIRNLPIISLTIWIFLIQIYGRLADYLSEVQYSLTG